MQRCRQGLRDLGDVALVRCRELVARLLVQELDDPHHHPVLVHDGDREDLPRPESGLLVPGRVEGKRVVDAGELGLVVGVCDVHPLAGLRDVPGHAGGVDRNPDFLHRVDVDEPRVDLASLTVHRVEGHPLRVEEIEHVLLEFDEEGVQVLRRVDAADELGELVAVGKLLPEAGDRVRRGDRSQPRLGAHASKGHVFRKVFAARHSRRFRPDCGRSSSLLLYTR